MRTNNAAYESESVIESLDYFPYGGQRVDTKANYGGVRNKYAGTVYDALSGLNYMQARYQNSSRGQFVSEDPVFLGDSSQQNLRDPKNLNSYSYANDNPITKSDPAGQYAIDYSRPVDTSGPLSNYSHSFVYIVPQPGEVLPPISSNGMSIDTSRPFVLGAFPVGIPGNWRLTMRANDPTDLAYAARQQSAPGVGRADVLPPGMTPAEYDANIVNAFNSLSTDQGGYNPSGWRQFFGSSNSNNANTSLLMNAGLLRAGMNTLTSQLSVNSRWAPGIGIPVNAPTYNASALASISATLRSISSTLSKMISSSGH